MMKNLWRGFSSAIRAGLKGTEGMGLLRIVLFVSVGLLPMLGMYLPHGVHSSSLSGQNNTHATKPLKINNSTQSLLVSDLQRNGQEARLSLHNNYQKDIAAFTISAQSYSVTLDFTPDLFRAGTVHVQSLAIPITSNAEDEVSIVAILFDDQTGDGDQNVIRQMMERRTAEKLQLLKILPLMDRALLAPKDQLSESLDAAEKAAMELPDSVNSTDSFEFRAGLHDAKERILHDLRTVKAIQKKHNILMLDSQLRYFQRNYALKISKLHN